MITTYRTQWFADTIEIAADWAQASCPVHGVDGGFQVADFRHRPELAMRRALEQCARADGLDDDEAQPLIDEAIDAMSEVSARYRVIDAPTNGSTGQDCGAFTLAELPERIRQAIEANPDAAEWTLPGLSGGDTGAELADLRTVVTRIE